MERVQVEEMDEGRKSAKKKMGTMTIQKNVMQGWGKGTRSLVNGARISPKKSR